MAIKLNTTNPITVEWVDECGQNRTDLEPVELHEYATDVTVNRSTASAVYSHKTGQPIANLLGYYNGNVLVPFVGQDYTVPGEIPSPVTFEWSITNGNVSGEVVQSPFSANLNSGNNTVVVPAFTDDWGNGTSAQSSSYTVAYNSGYVSPYSVDNDAVINWDILNTSSFDSSLDLVNNWYDSKQNRLLDKLAANAPTYEFNPFGVRAAKGASGRSLTYVETGDEFYKGAAKTYSFLISFIYQNDGVNPKCVYNRVESGTSEGFNVGTNTTGRLAIRWQSNTAGVFEQQFSGFTNGQHVAVILNVTGNVLAIYINDGQSRTNSPTIKDMTVNKNNTVLAGVLFGQNRPYDGFVHQIAWYDTILDATKRALYFSELNTKFKPI